VQGLWKSATTVSGTGQRYRGAGGDAVHGTVCLSGGSGLPGWREPLLDIHFDRQRQTVQRGPDTLSPDVRKCITASALVDFCLGRRSYFAVRTQSRRSAQVYDVMRTEHGVVARRRAARSADPHIINEMAALSPGNGLD